METDEITTAELASLLEQMGRRLHSQGYDSHLFPAQWAALRHVYLAAPELRTAIDIARFHGLASGSVARTVRTLITKGYLAKRGTIGRGRAEQLELTKRGLVLLKKDPMRKVAEALINLEPEERQILARSLETAIKATKAGEGPGGSEAVSIQAGTEPELG